MIRNLLFITVYVGLLASTMSCTWDQMTPTIDCSLSPVVVELLETQGTGCGAANGGFTLAATGGESPYSFDSGVGTNADGVFANVQAGVYAVEVTDVNDCTAELNVIVPNLGGVNLDEVKTNDAGCGSSNGSIEIVASGGEEPYAYTLDNGSAQADHVFSGLEKGMHTVVVADQLGCEISQSVEVLSGVSYNSTIQGIIENSCAISGCHNGSVFPDFRSFETIQARASSIKSRTANGSMPKGSTLSQTQIDQIACWVDDGALDN
ncbi:SprB repeat-containing protein [Reichenbachiella sp. MSK19-1]|uniref:SprB repeat-containing protein n=1 Tax=Reichenbachiella sp. MSK19-1 TaxID=1897631 RepID=UPI000E6BCAEC|nr:SprB repeat-containing protein [Reichenbachiella sp. MSK19-1]